MGAAAARAAGFGTVNSNIIAYKLLNKPLVKAYIDYLFKRMERKLEITLEKKLKLLWDTALRCYGPTEEEIEQIKNGVNVKVAFNFDAEALIKAVAEMNKMQGHYAQIKGIENIEEDKQKLVEELKKYEREC